MVWSVNNLRYGTAAHVAHVRRRPTSDGVGFLRLYSFEPVKRWTTTTSRRRRPLQRRGNRASRCDQRRSPVCEKSSAEDGADESEKNVREAAVATAARDFSGEPSGDEAEKNPTDEPAIDDYTEDLVYVSQVRTTRACSSS